MDTCRILMAQPLSKEDILYFEKEAKKGGLIVQETKKVESLRELYRNLKEIDNGGRKYNAVILQQCMDSENISAKELDKIRRSAPGIQILLCVANDTHGKKYLREVFDAGVYTAFFEKDGTIKNLVELLKNGRTAQAAISYYGIPHDEKTLQRAIGYMNKSRLAKQVNLIRAAETDEDISRVLQHLRKMLTPKELHFVIKHLDEEELTKVFFQRGMGIFFDKEQYSLDTEEHSGFFSKLLKQDKVSLSDYIIDIGTLTARMDLIKLQNEQKNEERKISNIPTEPTEREEPAEPTEPTEREESAEPTEPTEREEPAEPTEPTEPTISKVFSNSDPLTIVKNILENGVSQNELDQIEKMIEAEKNKNYSVNISPMHIKADIKKAKKYCVAAANKSAGATFITSVLAHTYKDVYPEHQVCVFSFQDTMAKFTNLIGLGSDSIASTNKISFQNVDYIIGKRSDIDELAYEYDAIFIDFKNVQAVGKDNRNTIFLVTQGKKSNIPELQKTADFVNEHRILNTTLLINLTDFEPEDEMELKRMLAWKECVNIPHLKSATRGLKMCQEFFDNEKKKGE